MTKVETYRLVAANGNHIRMATKVTFADGYVVRFIDRMSKREAARQAFVIRSRDASRG